LTRYYKDGKLWGDRGTFVENKDLVNKDSKVFDETYDFKDYAFDTKGKLDWLTGKERKQSNKTPCDFRVGRYWTGRCFGRKNSGSYWSKKACETVKDKYGNEVKVRGAEFKKFAPAKFEAYEEIVKLLEKLEKGKLTKEEEKIIVKQLDGHKNKMASGELVYNSKTPSESDYAVGKCCYGSFDKKHVPTKKMNSKTVLKHVPTKKINSKTVLTQSIIM